MPKPSLRGAVVGIALTATVASATAFAQINGVARPGALGNRPIPTTTAPDAARRAVVPAANFQAGASAQARGAALRKRAVDYARTGDFNAARTTFEQARAQTPRDCELLADYGYALYLAGDYAAAERVLKQSIGVDTNHGRSWNNLGRVLVAQGRMKDGWAALLRGGDQADAYSNLGSVFARAKDYDRARQAYTQALKLDPKRESAQVGLARIAELTGQPAGEGAVPPRRLTVDLNGAERMSPTVAGQSGGGPTPATPLDNEMQMSESVVTSNEGPSFTIPSFDEPLDIEPQPAPPTPKEAVAESRPATGRRTISSESPGPTASTPTRTKTAASPAPNGGWTPAPRAPKNSEPESPAEAPEEVASSKPETPVAGAEEAASEPPAPTPAQAPNLAESPKAEAPSVAASMTNADKGEPTVAGEPSPVPATAPRVIRSSSGAPTPTPAEVAAPAESPTPADEAIPAAPAAAESVASTPSPAMADQPKATPAPASPRIAALPAIGSALQSQAQETGVATQESRAPVAVEQSQPSPTEAPAADAPTNTPENNRTPRMPRMFEEVSPAPAPRREAAPTAPAAPTPAPLPEVAPAPAAAPAPVESPTPVQPQPIQSSSPIANDAPIEAMREAGPTPAAPQEAQSPAELTPTEEPTLAPTSEPNLTPVPAPPAPAAEEAPTPVESRLAGESPSAAETRPEPKRSSAPLAPEPPSIMLSRRAKSNDAVAAPAAPDANALEKVELDIYDTPVDVVRSDENEEMLIPSEAATAGSSPAPSVASPQQKFQTSDSPSPAPAVKSETAQSPAPIEHDAPGEAETKAPKRISSSKSDTVQTPAPAPAKTPAFGSKSSSDLGEAEVRSSSPTPAAPRGREVTADRRASETTKEPTPGFMPKPLKASPIPTTTEPLPDPSASGSRRAKSNSSEPATPPQTETPGKRKTAAFGVRKASAEEPAAETEVSDETSRRETVRVRSAAPTRWLVEQHSSGAAAR